MRGTQRVKFFAYCNQLLLNAYLRSCEIQLLVMMSESRSSGTPLTKQLPSVRAATFLLKSRRAFVVGIRLLCRTNRKSHREILPFFKPRATESSSESQCHHRHRQGCGGWRRDPAHSIPQIGKCDFSPFQAILRLFLFQMCFFSGRFWCCMLGFCSSVRSMRIRMPKNTFA